MLPTSHGLSTGSVVYEQTTNCTQSIPLNPNHLPVLDVSERCVIEQAVQNGKLMRYQCPINIASLLAMLPLAIQEKLSVILITHEGQSLPYYDKISYSFHVVLQCNSEDGPIIIDPVNPGGAINNAGIWIKTFIAPLTLQKALINDHTIECYLPQFRFITSTIFKDRTEDELYCDSDRFSLEHPNLAIKDQMDEVQSDLWVNSVFLNMYETYQFFSGHTSFQEVANYHQGSHVPPYRRLSDDHIRTLRSFGTLSGYKLKSP